MTTGDGVNRFEEWRPIAGFEAYEASSHGRVRRVKGGRGAQPGRILKPKPHRHGYAVFDLSIEDKVTRMTAAHALALAFHGEPPPGRYQAAHGNGDPTADTIANVRWATPKENADDADRHGRRRRGRRHQNSKLTERDVLAMRELREAGVTYRALSSMFGVSVSNAFEACAGNRQWSHI